jgi:TRAP-type C4-dicarboxylate transport system substrate-binding protein
MTTRLAPWLLALLLALPATPAAAQEIKLKLSHFVPPSHNHHTAVVAPWVEEVKKRTNGRVEITIFPGASLCSTSACGTASPTSRSR